MTDAPFSAPAGQPTAPSTDQPTAPPLRPEARRSATDRMAGGVCGGLADYSGVDAVLWRVGFVALTLIGGSGVLLYLLLWVLLPPAPTGDEPLSPLERLARRLHAAVNGSRAPRPPV
ncbi:PspC domain-containing protein [Blastococcus sp. TML/M2B]|uniref:PspC domain-containing protein n=1 Tax=unclassified Blastococcus TaxID=2619396 RepID=UPI00190DB85F|nr:MULTISPECIES: PspC domain-containing protein [unclassified Blastococcus]MBN1091664.1 PspC domain-containing protein [Blastococcus sp. TML/M2B]MBN1094781.1 PspC domain-containing protein [Blastococcus sp. TML/C7B]